MTQFVLFHPELGYFAGSKGYKYWTMDVQYARKWNRSCDATNCKNQTSGQWLTGDAEILRIDTPNIELS